MRMSTTLFYHRAISGILEQQATLSKTQNQVATGRRIETPADDPISSVHIIELQRAKTEADQYGRNIDAAVARLSLEEDAIGDTSLLLQRVRELVLQVNNSTMDAGSRRAIATEISQRAQELLDISNRQDGHGEYLFAGYATGTQPFARSGANVAYSGDQGERFLQIGPSQRVADSHSGFRVFQDIRQGNGTFVTGVNSANTGSGVIDTGSVVNQAAWVADTYTINFTSPTTWEVRNGAATLVSSGTYVSGGSIAFNGVQVSVSGAPATGDRFTVAASQREDIFTTLDRIVTSLTTAIDTPAGRAQFSSSMNIALEQLDRDSTHLEQVRAEIGTRLSLLDNAEDARADFDVEVQRVLSDLRDIDYTEAISRMNRQMIGLQAAQQSYASIAQLSLFNYL